jgi:hypothetical protein
MIPSPILYAVKPCGCVALVMDLDPDTDQDKLVMIRRVIKRRGYRLEWLTAEEHAARPWECPEHRAQRVRVAREKIAHQEGPALKG